MKPARWEAQWQEVRCIHVADDVGCRVGVEVGEPLSESCIPKVARAGCERGMESAILQVKHVSEVNEILQRSEVIEPHKSSAAKGVTGSVQPQ